MINEKQSMYAKMLDYKELEQEKKEKAKDKWDRQKEFNRKNIEGLRNG